MIYLVALIAALTGFLFGYDEGIIAGTLSVLEKQFALDNVSTGLVTGILPFGALLGSMIIGLLIATQFVVHLGRKRTIVLAAILFIIGALIATLAASIHPLASVIETTYEPLSNPKTESAIEPVLQA